MAQAPGPTSTASTGAVTREPGPFARVLVPVDFSISARAAYELAARVTAPWGSEIVLFNSPGLSENDGFLQGTGAPGWQKSDLIAEARQHLRTFAETVAPDSAPRVRVEARRDDDFVKSLVRACEELDASLLVVGSTVATRPRWRRSTAERVARAVRCPVLVVPA